MCAMAEGLFARSLDAASKGWRKVRRLPMPCAPAHSTLLTSGAHRAQCSSTRSRDGASRTSREQT